MNSSAAILAPLALMLPLPADSPFHAAPAAAPVEEVARAAPPASGKLPALGFRAPAPEPFGAIEEGHRPPLARQVRIEQRVIIRIAPSGPEASERMLDDLPRRPIRESFAEQPINGCVPINGIVGVQPARENRLLLFMRDHRVLSAALERACNSADFYSGFYVERGDDGALCSRRDRLQSRSGASCQVTGFSRLVAVRD